MVQNKGLIFVEPPVGLPVVGKHLKIIDRPIDIDSTSAPEGGLLLKNNYISFDPYQRGRMRDASIKSYAPAFPINEPVSNRGIATVLKSGTDKFKEGEVVQVDMLNTEEYSLLDAKTANATAKKIENPYDLDPMYYIGVLGMPGLTAYSSFYDIGKPKKGETIFISAASGAVGALVGQLAKHEGLTVIGSVGDDKKLDYITKELGFHGGFNYKKEKPAAALQRLAPEGIDIYYENVGGEHLDAAINSMKTKGRIVACGMISQYNVQPGEGYGVTNMMQFVSKRLTMRGFIVGDADMGPLYAKEHQKNVQQWLHDGSFKASMHVTKGIDHAGEGLLELFSGANFGKAVLEISPLQ